MRRHRRLALAAALLLGAPLVIAGISPATAAVPFEIQSLDGSGNNRANPAWGKAGTDYSRVAAARYADGKSEPVSGPNARYVSNRIFNDVHQNLFSERVATQWGFTWGQFLDHTFGLRLGRAPGDPNAEIRNIPFDSDDPQEEFTNTLGFIPFERSVPSPGTGVTSPRQQVNTVSSYIDAHAVYGPGNTRLTWLRDGAKLLLDDGYLPRRDARGDPSSAPIMEIDGRLRANPDRAAVAGDIRANENIALQATHTLFAREHNRIVDLLPSSLSREDKFQIARRIVIAEQQYITYNEFLPAIGVHVAPYRGYKSTVNTALSNEFATVGYRAHSMIHGEVEMETNVDRYSEEALEELEAQGVEITIEGDDVELAVPLNVGFFNPDLVETLQLGPLLQGIGLEAQYKNDDQIDNQLRSVLFQVPVPGNPDCLDGPTLPQCFRGVVDLGAIDIARGRDHGMPSYNQLRRAYGLPEKTSFRSITGEPTESFPPGLGIDDPASLEFVRLFNFGGDSIPLGSPEAESDPVNGDRRTTLAARLKAIYGSVSNLDAFTGMLAERHAAHADMGELQLAIMKREFERLRDGDRFFYGNDPGLSWIKHRYGIDYRRPLGDIIALNTDIPRDELNFNVFLVGDVESARCQVDFTIAHQWPRGFEASVIVRNNTSRTINGWAVNWKNPGGQTVGHHWDARRTQNGPFVTMRNPRNYHQTIPPGGFRQFGFIGSWDSVTNAEPASFTLNNMACVVG